MRRIDTTRQHRPRRTGRVCVLPRHQGGKLLDIVLGMVKKRSAFKAGRILDKKVIIG